MDEENVTLEEIRVPITELPPATDVSSADLLAGVQDNTTKKFSLAAILAWLKTKITAAELDVVPNTRKVNGHSLFADVTVTSADVGAVSATEKGASNGVAELDSGGKVPTAQLPAIPAPSDAAPQALSTAAAGSSADYSRADHVHQKPTYSASDVGLGNVANERQYSAQNPPPADANKQDKITASGILKGNGSGGVSAAVAGTDYGTYSLPSGGIPKTDLASGVQTSLGKADTAYQKPSGGIPSSDMASAVQTSLGKADTAYQKPSGGIPASDLASGVIPTVPSISTNNPAMDGTASPGSTGKVSDAGHVHPTDTSRQAKITASGILKGNGSGGVSAAVAGSDYQAPLVIDDYPVLGSENPVTSDGVALALIDWHTYMMEVFEITSFSSLPKTVQFAEISDKHRVLRMRLSNPRAQLGEWTVTTASGSVTISGSISGSTAVTLILGYPVTTD